MIDQYYTVGDDKGRQLPNAKAFPTLVEAVDDARSRHNYASPPINGCLTILHVRAETVDSVWR